MNRSARISFRQIDSSRSRLFGLVALALLVALLAAGARSSNASADVFPPLNPFQACATAAAHATRTLSLQLVVVTSNGANYHYYPQGLCNRYLVDLVVPGDHGTDALGWKSPMLFGGCANLSEDITIYTTTLSSSSFSKVGSAHFQGATATSPQTSYCTLVQTQGDPVASVHVTREWEIDWIFLLPHRPDTWFTKTIRVAASVSYGYAWEPVTVCAAGGPLDTSIDWTPPDPLDPPGCYQ